MEYLKDVRGTVISASLTKRCLPISQCMAKGWGGCVIIFGDVSHCQICEVTLSSCPQGMLRRLYGPIY